MIAELEEAFAKYEQACELLAAGDVERGMGLLRAAAADGLGFAYLELAEQARRDGNEDEVRRCLRAIEDLAARDDPVALYSAYQAYLTRLGEQDRHAQDRIANERLRRAAELGNSFCQVTLAENYRSGANGLSEDVSQYEFWIQKAVDAGFEDAVCSFVEYLLERRRTVSSELKEKLVAAAKDFSPAAKLLVRVQKAKAPRVKRGHGKL